MDITFTCLDTKMCDQNGKCTGPEVYHSLRPWGRCHPTDCDWGTQRATRMVDGWLGAVFSFGFKTSHVKVKRYASAEGIQLRVVVFNDFTDSDGRTDYTTDEWMVRDAGGELR